MKQLLSFLLFSLAIVGCQKSSPDNPVIVAAFDEQLMLKDIQAVLPMDIHSEDSLLFVKNYIRQWIEKKVLLHEASKVIRKDYKEELEQYRQSLLIYDYQKNVVEQRLSTEVSDEEIETYYHKNKNDFLLRENILRCLYVKIAIADERQAVAIRNILFRTVSVSDSYLQDLFKLASVAVNTFFTPEIWLRFSDFTREVPVPITNEELFLQTHRTVELKDENFIYLARILEYKTKESVSPLVFEQNNIREIILNKRKQNILNDLRLELLRSAEENREIHQKQ